DYTDQKLGQLNSDINGIRDAGAFAFGAGYTSEDGRIRGNLSGTAAGGHVGVGAGISFTLN
ncbi:YadA-like family protein, partial [Mesorhizobium sp. M7A.F.Ca.CA.001.16.1.1]|uniref:YadA-like family protein n=1 Tax=Mesorhizobium sp. M7A.F.Ca.CA.001.16.1.1 TaxID=2496683 RepID=UPI0013E2A74E